MSYSGELKNRKRKKTHGYLVRKKTKAGINVLKRRIKKGRKKISA